MGVNTDRDAIIALTISYCWAVDTKAWDQLRNVFTEDATARMGSTDQSSRDEIIERIRIALSPLESSQHLVSNHQVDVDGDVASGRCYLQAQHNRPDFEGGSLWLAGGRYEDEFTRTEDGWRIRHRALTIMWHEGNRSVMGR